MWRLRSSSKRSLAWPMLYALLRYILVSCVTKTSYESVWDLNQLRTDFVPFSNFFELSWTPAALQSLP